MSLYKELSRCPDSILLLVDWTQNADVLFKKMINVSFIETKQKRHCLKEECNHSIKKVHVAQDKAAFASCCKLVLVSAHVLETMR